MPRPDRLPARAASPCAVEPLEPRRLLAATPVPLDGGPTVDEAAYAGRFDGPRTRLVVSADPPADPARPGATYYRIRLDRPLRLEARVEPTGDDPATTAYSVFDDFELSVFRPAGTFRETYPDRDSAPRVAVVDLGRGTHYLQVGRDGGRRDAGFRLRLRAIDLADPDGALDAGHVGPGTGYPAARRDVTISRDQAQRAVYGGHVRATAAVDVGRGRYGRPAPTQFVIFAFDPTGPTGTLRLRLVGRDDDATPTNGGGDAPAGDADLALFDSNGRLLGRSTADGRAVEEVVASGLTKGNYFARVDARTAGAEFAARLVADEPVETQPVPPARATPPTLSRDQAQGATPVGTAGGRARLADGAVGSTDARLDGGAAFYRVEVDRTAVLATELTKVRGDGADLAVFDAGGKLLGRSTNDGTDGERIDRTVAPGSYFVRVDSRYGRGGSFRARFFTPPPEPVAADGRVYSGSLGRGDQIVAGDPARPAGRTGEYYLDAWVFDPRNSGTARVWMTGGEIDGSLALAKYAPGRGRLIELLPWQTDDPDSTDTSAVFAVERGYDYVLFVSSVGPRDEGAYTLTFSNDLFHVGPLALDF